MECELCGNKEDYCSECNTCHACLEENQKEIQSQLKEKEEENRKLKEGVKVGKTIDYGEWLSYPCKNFDNCEINKSLHCYSLKPCFGTI